MSEQLYVCENAKDCVNIFCHAKKPHTMNRACHLVVHCSGFSNDCICLPVATERCTSDPDAAMARKLATCHLDSSYYDAIKRLLLRLADKVEGK